MSRPRRCVHYCRCGAVLICADPDNCAAGEHWTCPSCDLAAFDACLHAQAAQHAHAQHVTQETHTHEGI